ncbi:hypothetical protein [Haloarchaeobius amylolyticus]|uniref:hypothetical protein n=1 Tax=Haloarchaeobius amylolyticus TaxID=1198296 RepID=UPI002271F647|nr:hypothetical protein [Haloarchaeobius amylolyticus]
MSRGAATPAEPVAVVATRRFAGVSPDALWEAVGDPADLEAAVTLVDATASVTTREYPHVSLDLAGEGDYGGLTGTVCLKVDAHEFAALLHWESRLRPTSDLVTLRPRDLRPVLTRFADRYAGVVGAQLGSG